MTFVLLAGIALPATTLMSCNPSGGNTINIASTTNVPTPINVTSEAFADVQKNCGIPCTVTLASTVPITSQDTAHYILIRISAEDYRNRIAGGSTAH